MFYTNNPDQPILNFTLTPMSLSPNISRFTLNISGQIINFELGIKPVTQASWARF